MKVHLIFSNIITEKRLWTNNTVSVADSRNRPSMAYSTIESLRGAPIQSAQFFLEFDETTSWSRRAIERQIRSLPFNSEVHFARLVSFEDWRSAARASESTSAENIMLFTNEDHVHVQPDFSELMFHIDLLAKAQSANLDRVITLPLSHYPETHALIPISTFSGTGLSFEEVPLVPCQIAAGPIVVGKQQFLDFWQEDFTGGMPFVGLENPRGPSLRFVNGFALPPRSELFRHLDSYGHIGLAEWPFNPVSPRYQLTLATYKGPVIHPVETVNSLSRPNGSLDYILAGPRLAGSVVADLDVSLLLASSVRPSWRSARWVASRFNLRQSAVRGRLLRLILTQKNLRARIYWTVVDSPIIALLLIARLVFGPFKKLRLHLYWYLTYGSSIGYWKLLRDALVPKVTALGRNTSGE